MIRTAEARDRLRCVQLMRAFHDELGQSLFPADAAYGAAIFERFATRPEHVAFVYEDAGAVVGMLFAQAGWHDLGPMRVATERLWYVEKPHRAKAWRPMLRAFEAWAREQGCGSVSMVALEGNAAVGHIYKRSGYTPVETHYMKRV